MKNNIQKSGDFTNLNPAAKIFALLKNNPPQWWLEFTNDEELYIDIRKDNYINVYYFGGRVAKIEYRTRKGFVAEIHQKYLGDTVPRRRSSKGNDVFENDSLDLSTINKKTLRDIKDNIRKHYLDRVDKEKPPEKKLQGDLIINNSCYIDSEFQYNKDDLIGNLRIDFVKLLDNELTFVELKGISDSRLRKADDSTPEVVSQINLYRKFIDSYEDELLQYYKKLINLKKELGLIDFETPSNLFLNKEPELLVIDTYEKETAQRKKRIDCIEKHLEANGIIYSIEKHSFHHDFEKNSAKTSN